MPDENIERRLEKVCEDVGEVISEQFTANTLA